MSSPASPQAIAPACSTNLTTVLSDVLSSLLLPTRQFCQLTLTSIGDLDLTANGVDHCSWLLSQSYLVPAEHATLPWFWPRLVPRTRRWHLQRCSNCIIDTIHIHTLTCRARSSLLGQPLSPYRPRYPVIVITPPRRLYPVFLLLLPLRHHRSRSIRQHRHASAIGRGHWRATVQGPPKIPTAKTKEIGILRDRLLNSLRLC